jgi:hypothetical protein
MAEPIPFVDELNELPLIQARPATPEERAESVGFEEKKEPLRYVPAPAPGYEFAEKSPFIVNMLESESLSNDQKAEIIDEFQRGADTWESEKQQRIETHNRFMGGLKNLPLLDSLQRHEIEQLAESNFDPERPLLRERAGENFKNAWLGIDTIPTSAGAAFRYKELGLGQRDLIAIQRATISDMQREIDIREGILDPAYSSPTWSQFPTEFLKRESARIEAMIPSEQIEFKKQQFEGIKKQAFRAGRFAKMPEWESYREGAASLLGYLGGSAATLESLVIFPGASAGTPILKALAIKAGGAAAISGAVSAAAEPLIQDVAAQNFVQKGFSLESGMERAFLAMFLAGGFNVVGDLAGRFWKRFGMDPEKLRGLDVDDTIEAISQKTGRTEDVVRKQMSGVYREYAEDASVKLPRTQVRVADDTTDVIGRPYEAGSLSPEELAALPTIQAEPVGDVAQKQLKFTKTFAESPKTAQALKEDPFKEWLKEFYDPINNPDTLKQAQATIDKIGEQKTFALVTTTENPTALTNAMGMDLIRRMENRDDYDLIPDITKAIARGSKTQGQSIQSLSMWNRMTPEGVLVTAQRKLDALRELFPHRKIPESLTKEQNEELVRLSKAALAAKTPTDKLVKAAVVDMALNTMVDPSDMATKIRTVRIISMLSNPKTLIRNVGGNQFLFFANMASEYLDVPVDQATSIIRAGWTGENPRIYRTKAVPSFKAKSKGFLEPVDEFVEGYKISFPSEGKSDPNFKPWKPYLAAQHEALNGALEYMATLGKLTSQNKFEMQSVRDINKWVFDSDTGKGIEKMLALALGVPDRAFWWSAVRNSIDQQMRVYAINNGIMPAAPTQAMVEKAYIEGAKAIFQDENVFSRFAFATRKWLNFNPFGEKGDRTFKLGLGDVVVPFAQVPATLAKVAVDYSPAGYAKAIYNAVETLPIPKIGGRSFDQKAFVESISKATLGTGGLFGMGYFMASHGIINSTLDEDPDVAAYQRSMGFNAYRLNWSALKRKMVTGFTDPIEALKSEKDEGKSGDILFSYAWAQPLSLSIAMGAEWYNIQKEEARTGKKTNKEALLDIVQAFDAGAKTFKELSFLQSLNSFHETTANYGYWEGIKQTVLRDLPASFIPTFVNQIEQNENNIIRDIKGPDEFESAYLRVANRVPEIVKLMGYPPSRDVWGEIVRRYPNAEQDIWFNIYLNPALMSTLQKEPVGDELMRLYEATGESGFFPRKAPFQVEVNGEKKVLTPIERSLYQQWVGRLTRDVFHNAIQSKEWMKKPDEQKAKELAGWIIDISASGKVALLGHDRSKLDRRGRFFLDKGKEKEKAGELFDTEQQQQ